MTSRPGLVSAAAQPLVVADGCAAPRSGARDGPGLAVAALIPGAALVPLPTAGHSILDTREAAALRIASDLVAGHAGDLPAQGPELDAMPVRPEVKLLGLAIEAAARVEGALPAAVPRLFQAITS